VQLFSEPEPLAEVVLEAAIIQIRFHALKLLDERAESRSNILAVGQANVAPDRVRTLG
jgi:hypothetical protein